MGVTRRFWDPFSHRGKRGRSGCFVEDLRWAFAEHTPDSGCRDAVAFGYLAKALALAAVMLDGGVVQYQRIASAVLAVEPCAPHAGAHPFDNKVAFQFGDGADDDDDSPAQWAAGVDVFSERDVLDVQSAQLIQNIEEVFHRPGDSV